MRTAAMEYLRELNGATGRLASTRAYTAALRDFPQNSS
jgi:hypothetical protein